MKGAPMSKIKEFGSVAKGLARNPLGIIALFIVLVYAFAALVVGASGNLQPNEREPLVWFLVLFPFIVLAVFAWLVSFHHDKLYAPSDFADEANFMNLAKKVIDASSVVGELRRITYGGEVVAVDGHGYWISEDGRTKTLIPDIQTAQFFASSKGIIEISDNQEQARIRALATEPEKMESVLRGRLVVTRRSGHVFIILNSKRYYVSSCDSLVEWGRTNPEGIDEDEIRAIPSGKLSTRIEALLPS